MFAEGIEMQTRVKIGLIQIFQFFWSKWSLFCEKMCLLSEFCWFLIYSKSIFLKIENVVTATVNLRNNVLTLL